MLRLASNDRATEQTIFAPGPKGPPRPGVVASNQAPSGIIWSAGALFGASVWLADPVVPWHNFNLVGFGLVDFQACHSKYQSSRCQAETLSLYRCCIDLVG
jgi:hypothetical protein